MNSRDYFELYVDGTKDRNEVECISIAARYVLDGKSYKSFLGLKVCNDLSARGISEVIFKFLEASGVDTDKMLSQCHDGARVMSGEKGGMQMILQERFKRRVPYIHCFSHSFHYI